MSLQQTAVSREGRFGHEAALAVCAVGDVAALRRLYEREAANLVGVAVRILRRRDLAHDVVHDAFLQIWHAPRRSTRRAGLAGPGSSAWFAINASRS